jgi:hypothetical protein
LLHKRVQAYAIVDQHTMKILAGYFAFCGVTLCQAVAGMGTDFGDAAASWKVLQNGIAEANDVQAPVRNWEFVVIHHSATLSGSLESIHREHQSRRDGSGNPWLGIGYHFVIGNGAGMADGQISSTFRWKQQIHGAHSGSLQYNDRGIGICLIGNFEKSRPSPAQLEAVTELLKLLAERYRIPSTKIVGHKNIRATACPGRHFPMTDVVDKLKQELGSAHSIHIHSYFPEHPDHF